MGTSIQTVSHWHEQIVDWMLSNPSLRLMDCATYFKKSGNWISVIIHSDAFKEYKNRRFAAHHEHITERVADQLQGLGKLSMEVLHERIDAERAVISLDFVKETNEMVLRAMGFGSKHAPEPMNGGPSITVNIGAAPQSVLTEARDDMRRIHTDNTTEAEAADDQALPQLPPLGEPNLRPPVDGSPATHTEGEG